MIESTKLTTDLVGNEETVELFLAEEWNYNQRTDIGTMRVLIEVTPRLAKHFLDKHNQRSARKIITSWANQIAKAMGRNEWKYATSTISFRSDGTLANGQNRLQAVILLNKPVLLVLEFGLTDEEASHHNKARPDKMSTLLNAQGITRAATKAPVIKGIWELDSLKEGQLLGNGISPFMVYPTGAINDAFATWAINNVSGRINASTHLRIALAYAYSAFPLKTQNFWRLVSGELNPTLRSPAAGLSYLLKSQAFPGDPTSRKDRTKAICRILNFAHLHCEKGHNYQIVSTGTIRSALTKIRDTEDGLCFFRQARAKMEYILKDE